MREVYDEGQAAGWLRAPRAAWRSAASSGLVPAADAGTAGGRKAVVEAADREAIWAALPTRLVPGWQRRS